MQMTVILSWHCFYLLEFVESDRPGAERVVAAEGSQHGASPAADAGLHLRRPAIGVVVFIVER